MPPFIKELLHVSILVLIVMSLVELVELRWSKAVKKKIVNNPNTQKFLGSMLGILPGCGGTFAADAMYMAGLLGFGGITATMLATAGDEAFVIWTGVAGGGHLTPVVALTLLASQFVVGIIGGFIATFIARKFKLTFAAKCEIEHHDHEHSHWLGWNHFFTGHMWNHILRGHFPRIIGWLAFSLLIVELFSGQLELINSAPDSKWIALGMAAAVGLIPISGPHLLFITMFAAGHVPFSVMLTSCLVQNGHGMLPLIGFSLDDTLKIKAVNLGVGLAAGLILMLFGF
jgi:hypothetical protein